MNKTAFFSELRRGLFKGRLSQSQVDGINLLLEATEGQPDAYRAYMLATAYHETAHTMQPIYERGGRKYFRKYDGRKDLGNTQKGDGYRFRGRGFVQITGRRNYEVFSSRLGVDLVANPDLALDQKLAARILVIGMTEGLFTGKKLSDFPAGDFAVMARKVVNGTDRAELIAGYAEDFAQALDAGQRYVPMGPEQIPTTGKSPVKSRTNLAAISAGASVAASTSRDVKSIISGWGIDPQTLLLVIVGAAVAWIIYDRISKMKRFGV